uniref:Hyaluronidase n=1 Tax=Myripristis murdjan TaxID=586833 RepID=A0A667YD86_9TELE
MPVVPVGGSSSHHVVPVALTCSWLLVFFHAAFGQKPAKLPLLGRKPFLAAWNAPLDMCTIKYNVTANLDRLFHIHGSPRATRTGQNVTIFYANRLGNYPYYTEQGVAVHGGLPQNCSLDFHLFKAYQDITHFIPAEDFRGLAVIDWEFWRPQWSRNWHKKDIYRRKSQAADRCCCVSWLQVEELARKRFEKSARAFMQRTIQLGTRLRPNGLWGFYLYPDCHNYNLHNSNYTGLCPLLERLRNDELLWLWNSSTALFPSVAIRKSHTNSISNLRFAQHRIREALRVASLTSREYDLPTYVYLSHRSVSARVFLQKDLVHTIGESAALGAAGFVIWGDLNLTSSRVKWFLSRRLGQYITNVTRAAEVCSDFLCQGNGRCVRRDPRARHYLHLSADSYHIQPFRCHCYEGHAGEKCDSLNKVVEDDLDWRDKDKEQEERWRTDWEDEQGDQGDGQDSAAAPGGCSVSLMLLLLLLNLSLVRTVV